MRRTSGLLWWGFCSIRSWLAEYLRRVAALMIQFPPIGAAASHGYRVWALQTRRPGYLKPLSPLRAQAVPQLKPSSPLRVRNGRFWSVFRLQWCCWFQRLLFRGVPWRYVVCCGPAAARGRCGQARGPFEAAAPPGIRQRRDPEGSRLSLCAVAAPSAPISQRRKLSARASAR